MMKHSTNNSTNEKMNEFEDINVPPLPSAFQIVFRCRDCDYTWRLQMELPALVKVFYSQNKCCYNCKSVNIVMDITPMSEK